MSGNGKIDHPKVEQYLRISGLLPEKFQGKLTLPPSKSYLHRALFVSSLCSTPSLIQNCGDSLSQDIKASISSLVSLGSIIRKDGTNISVCPIEEISSAKKELFTGGSGTTARLLIPFVAIRRDGGQTTISGDESLLKRPMQSLLDALKQIGVRSYSKNNDGRLPVVVAGEGIEGGGRCIVDGSVSSQFISALMLACTQARKDTAIVVKDKSEAVSTPYIKATLFVLKYFGFQIKFRDTPTSLSFEVKGNQRGIKGRVFRIPGDMSSAAALIGAALVAKGRIQLRGIDLRMPQADSFFLDIAKRFGARVSMSGREGIDVSWIIPRNQTTTNRTLTFDLKDSPDSVPILAGVAAGLGRSIKIRSVAHLRYKESDRLNSISEELRKLGVGVLVAEDSISIMQKRKAEMAKHDYLGERRILSPHNDHRILMSLAIAGLSGRFGEFFISDPSCVAKSYPSFVSDIKSFLNEKKNERNKIISIVKKRKCSGKKGEL